MISSKWKANTILLVAATVTSTLNILLMVSPRAQAQIQGALPAFVRVQPTTPGSQQTGHANISGTLVAGTLKGDGLAITNISATNLVTGTLADARLSTNVPLKNASNSFTQTQAFVSPGQPFSVTSSQLVPNLNADRLDGLDRSSFGLVHDYNLWDDQNDFIANSAGQVVLARNTGPTASAFALESVSDHGTGIGASSGANAVHFVHAGVSAYSELNMGVGALARSATAAAVFSQNLSTSIQTALAGPAGGVWTTGFVRRQYSPSSMSVSIPIAYGVVDGAGNVLSGTENFTSSRVSTGTYEVLVVGESYGNGSHVVTVTPVSSSPRVFGVTNPGNDAFRLRIWDLGSVLTDTQFQFTIWTRTPNAGG